MSKKQRLVVGYRYYTGKDCPFKGTILLLTNKIQLPLDVPSWGYNVAIMSVETGHLDGVDGVRDDDTGLFFLSESEIGDKVM